MAANFWTSTHCQRWLLSRQKVLESQKEDREVVSDVELRAARIFYTRFIHGAGRALNLRQQVIATAIVYFRRFYTRNSFRQCDPLLVGPTCLYLACKVEECTPTPASNMIERIRSYVAENELLGRYTYTAEDLLECEFYLLEELDCCITVFHPYRPLVQYLEDLNMKQYLSMAWRLVNDSYHTDVCLLYPPYLTALAALYIAVILSDVKSPAAVAQAQPNPASPVPSGHAVATPPAAAPPASTSASASASVASMAASFNAANQSAATSSALAELRTWYSNLNVDLDEVAEVSQHIMGLYEFWSVMEGDSKEVNLPDVLHRLRTVR